MTAAVVPLGLESPEPVKLPIGKMGPGPAFLDLGRLMAGRMLIQGSSGAGKSETLRKIVEEAFEYVTTMIVDPEGEFANLARHIGATTLVASELSVEGLTAAAVRGRTNRLPLHLDLSDLGADDRINKAAAFFTGLTEAPREAWPNTVLVAIDEAHLLAPHVAASSRDAETRRLGVATLTDLCARGRKRGVATIVATQRLAKLASSVTSELHNLLIGLNVYDQDIKRAGGLLGIGSAADRLSRLSPGEFYAIGPALSHRANLVLMDRAATEHLGRTPALLGPADAGEDQARQLLDLDGLRETGVTQRRRGPGRPAGRALDDFLLDPAAQAATGLIGALRRISPNAATCEDLARHLGLDAEAIDDGLDLLSSLGAVDAMPRGDGRIARLSARLRTRSSDTQVVGLS